MCAQIERSYPDLIRLTNFAKLWIREMAAQVQVQRKLEFHVRKNTRSTRSKSAAGENQDPTVIPMSPRKRNTTYCSPTKKKREQQSPVRRSETPSRCSRTRVNIQTKESLGLASTQKSILSERIPLSPRKDLMGNNNTPSKVSKGKLLLSPLRNCNDLKKHVDVTPSREAAERLKNLVLFSPTGNSHVSKEKTPSRISEKKGRRLILSPRKDNASVTQENTPSKRVPSSKLKLQRQDSHAYLRAKQSFHTAKPDRLVGREPETKQILTFVERHLSQKSAGSIYISGAPGTGKTAVLSHILENVKDRYKCKSLYLNCMTLRDPATVYSKLYTDITGKTTSAKDRLKAIEKVLSTPGQSIILVLDEIDQLDSKNQEILYTIFEWPTLAKSRLILIGIANALDLTDRILPRLQARPKCKPELLNFAPYSKDQIASILKDRLHDLEDDGVSVMEPSAVQFCARKISAVAGDLRKALDVCRRSIEMVETDVRSQQILKVSTPDCRSPTKSPLVPKKISIVHINKVLSDIYGSSASVSHQDTIPLQQKLVVCTLLVVLKEGKMKEVTLGKLHETYCKICKKRQMAAVDNSEFQGVCTLLESRGILGIKKAKESRLAKITLKLDERELEHTLQDKVLVSTILHDGIPK
ncbi:hypothetical protein ScPMuIL_016990 [Solemya velum]